MSCVPNAVNNSFPDTCQALQLYVSAVAVLNVDSLIRVTSFISVSAVHQFAAAVSYYLPSNQQPAEIRGTVLLTQFHFTIYSLNTNLYFNRFNKLQCLDDPLRMK